MKKLRRLLFLLLIVLFFTPTFLSAQSNDTTWVQTYTFDSLWTRRAKFYFPTANQDFRKILMYFTIKCYNTVSGDGNFPCGEWDYIYFNNVYNNKGLLDSTRVDGHQFQLFNGSTPDSLRYSSTPLYDIYQSYLYNTILDNTISSNTYSIGANTVAMAHPFSQSAGKERAQFIWKAAELTSAGMTAGNITGLQLNFQNGNDTLKNVCIRIKATYKDSFSVHAMEVDTLTMVYNYATYPVSSGLNRFQFNTPFHWNGNSNLLVDISFDNKSIGPNNNLLGANTLYPSSLYTTTGNYCLNTLNHQEGQVSFAKSLNMFGGAAPRTYDLWVHVDTFGAWERAIFSAGKQWVNNRDFSFILKTAVNSIKCNFWSNDVNFNSTENFNQVWKHLAVSYASDTVKTYLNGKLINASYRPGVNTAALDQAFILGAWGTVGGAYQGKLSHLRIWDIALPLNTLQGLIGKDINSSDPNFSHLKADYRMNSGLGNRVEDFSSLHQNSGGLLGSMWWQPVQAKDMYYNTEKLNWRPQVVFERKVYTSHIDSTLVSDTIVKSPATVFIYGNPSNQTIYDDNDPNSPSVCTDTATVWTNQYSYTYLHQVLIDSTLNNLPLVYHNADKHWYSNKVVYEIGRSISPYGKNLNLTANGRQRVYDVTDYYQVLQDTVDLEVGSTQELQEVKFAFIKGTPPAVVNHIAQPWPQPNGYRQYKYGAIVSDSVLTPKIISLLPTTDEVKFKSYITGHGGDENASSSFPNGCCEFMYNDHYYKSNGQTISTFRIQRKDCGLNAIYPQGGTWVYDREGWCPGDIIRSTDKNVTPYKIGNQIHLDYQIASVAAGNENVYNGVYDVGLQVIEYKTPYYQNDAEIYDITRPGNRFEVSRFNPICNSPQIVLRNDGKNILSTAEIKYRVSGGAEETYLWNGSLRFLETAVVDLPVSSPNFWFGDGSNLFIARVAGVNNGPDEYAQNDTLFSSFNLPDVIPTQKIILRFKTNNDPQENELTLRDFSGNIVLQKTNLTANKTYLDTLQLPLGCYTLSLTDNGQQGQGDGLQWWANPDQGSGSFSIGNGNTGITIKNFTSDFGREIYYPFTVVYKLNAEHLTLNQAAEVYPNPNHGQFVIALKGFVGDVSVEMTDQLGRVVMTDQISALGNDTFKNYHMPELATGIYYIQFSSGNNTATKKLLIEK